MVEELDLLDRKILYELDIDSRQSLNKLARKLRRNRNVIEFRIKRLKQKGIIQSFVTLLDAGKLGLTIWSIYLEFQNLTPEIEKRIINYLKKHEKVWWIGQLTGKWNLIYGVVVRNIKEFYNTVRDFNTLYGQYILNQSLAAHVEVEVFSRGYFLNRPGTGVTWYKKFEPVEIDEIDKKILREMATNSRISSVEIANELGLTARIASYRIKDLMKRGVISRFRVLLDVSKFGYGFHKVLIELKTLSEKQNTALREYCKNLGTIFHYENKIGPWMLEFEMDAKSYEGVNEIMKKMKEDFPDYIKRYDIGLIYAEHKGELDLTKYI